MFQHLPVIFPTVLMALCFFAVFPILEYYGWITCVMMAIPLTILSETLMQGSIIPQNSRSSYGIAWGVIITLTYSYFHDIAPKTEHSFNLFVFMFLVLTVVSLVVSRRSSPVGDSLQQSMQLRYRPDIDCLFNFTHLTCTLENIQSQKALFNQTQS
jgi:hypothetical protein